MPSRANPGIFGVRRKSKKLGPQIQRNRDDFLYFSGNLKNRNTSRPRLKLKFKTNALGARLN
jgi:hypothetical protein